MSIINRELSKATDRHALTLADLIVVINIEWPFVGRENSHAKALQVTAPNEIWFVAQIGIVENFFGEFWHSVTHSLIVRAIVVSL